jgi:hypothetical protein
VPESKCFGYVQTYDDKPRRRLFEVMRSQGLQDHQQVIFMSDGGEDVRRVQTYLHPHSEHWIDWFHITMRITVLQQQIKSLQGEAKPCNEAAGLPKRIDSVKHLLWHGNVAEALDRLDEMQLDLEFIGDSPAAEKLAAGLSEFEIYIRNNRDFIPNFGERYRHGETISTAFVESTINQVISGALSRNNPCSGHCAAPIYCCRREQRFLTRNWTMCSGAGIRNSEGRQGRSLTPDLEADSDRRAAANITGRTQAYHDYKSLSIALCRPCRRNQASRLPSACPYPSSPITNTCSAASVFIRHSRRARAESFEPVSASNVETVSAARSLQVVWVLDLHPGRRSRRRARTGRGAPGRWRPRAPRMS